jgi:hypothetical protein
MSRHSFIKKHAFVHGRALTLSHANSIAATASSRLSVG